MTAAGCVKGNPTHIYRLPSKDGHNSSNHMLQQVHGNRDHCLVSDCPRCMPLMTVHGSAVNAEMHRSTLHASVPLMLTYSFPSDHDCGQEHHRYRQHASAFKQSSYNHGWVRGLIGRALLSSRSVYLIRRQRDLTEHAMILNRMRGKSLSVNLDMLSVLHTCLPFRSHTLSRYS